MLGYGMEQDGTVRYGDCILWYGMVCVVRYATVCDAMYGVVSYRSVCCDSCASVRHGTVTACYGTVWYGTLRNGVLWYGMLRYGMLSCATIV